MKKNPHTKLIAVSGGLVLIVLAIIFFVIIPLLSRISETKKDSAQIQKDLIKLNAETDDYRIAIGELARIDESIDAFQQIIPEKEQMVSLVEGMEDAINRAGISHELIITDEEEEALKQKTKQADPNAKPNPSVVPGLVQITEVPYELELGTDYRGLIDFLYHFEHLPYMSKFNQVSVVADTEQNQISQKITNLGTATVEIDGVFFVRSWK